MSLDDISLLFSYRKSMLPLLDAQIELQHSKVASAIIHNFQLYGWSIERLLGSNTKVMRALKSHITHKRPNTDAELDWPQLSNKRRRVDRSETSTSHLYHTPPAASLELLGPGNHSFDRTCNSLETRPGSNSIQLASFDAQNGSRNLTDPAMAYGIGYATNRADEFTDPVTADNHCFAVSQPDEFIDPATAGNLSCAVAGTDGFG